RDCHNVQQSQEETMKHTWLKHTARSALAAAGLALALQTGAMAQTELRIGHGHTEEHSFHLGLQKFVELLEQKAPGAFDATIFANAQLGSEREMQEQLPFGGLEVTVTGVLGIYEPKLALLELPFLFRDRDHVLAAQGSEAVEDLMSSLPPQGLRLIG